MVAGVQAIQSQKQTSSLRLPGLLHSKYLFTLKRKEKCFTSMKQRKTSSGIDNRNNLREALLYLDQVKVEFSDRPSLYDEFLEILNSLESHDIDIPSVIRRVAYLFRGCNSQKLIIGFNSFLPDGYKVKLVEDLDDSTNQSDTHYYPLAHPNSHLPPIMTERGIGGPYSTKHQDVHLPSISMLASAAAASGVYVTSDSSPHSMAANKHQLQIMNAISNGQFEALNSKPKALSRSAIQVSSGSITSIGSGCAGENNKNGRKRSFSSLSSKGYTNHRVTSSSTTTTARPRRVIPEEKVFIDETEPRDTDVVSGRGGRSNNHPGNRKHWLIMLQHRQIYNACGKTDDVEKNRIAQMVVDYVYNEQGGRYVQRDKETGRWFILPNKVALEKVKQGLRDKHVPDWVKDDDKIISLGYCR